jgi:hypothetical protein
MNRRQILQSAALTAVPGQVQEPPPAPPPPLPVPRMQVLPLPDEQASFQRDGAEITRYHFGKGLLRPFLYPVIGPSGRSLTRMGHPHAAVSHSHHNSVWVSHNDVNGDVFWADNGPGRIVHQWMVEYTDAEGSASLVGINHWIGKGDRVHLIERRGIRTVNLADSEWLLLLDLQFEANRQPVSLGKTPFGMAAVRMAKSIGVNDGGGGIRNSEGNVDEQGPNGVFWKRARWADYSGPIAGTVQEGITLLDHPANPNHPTFFHVRRDGWMGAALTFDGPRTIEPGSLLRLRYGLYVHRGAPTLKAIDRQWERFAKTSIADLPNGRH